MPNYSVISRTTLRLCPVWGNAGMTVKQSKRYVKILRIFGEALPHSALALHSPIHRGSPKDFPLSGYAEVRYDDLEKRVVYDRNDSRVQLATDTISIATPFLSFLHRMPNRLLHRLLHHALHLFSR